MMRLNENNIKVIQYRQEYRNDWDDFVRESKIPIFMFMRNFMEYHRDRFTDNSLIFFKNEAIVALLPCSIKDKILYSHGGLTYGGFIYNESMKQSLMLDCFDKLSAYILDKGIKSIIYKCVPRQYHLQPAEEDRYALYYNNAYLSKIEASTVINLLNPLEMAKLRKRQIKKAKKKGVEVKWTDEKEDYEEYIDLLNSVLLEHHGKKAVHTFEELFSLHSLFMENIKLVVATLNYEILAGVVLFIYPKVVHTQYLASSDYGRKIGALDIVIDEVINAYRDEKEWLDFGISTEDNGKYLNRGLISQKEGFGGRTIVYETWKYTWEEMQQCD